MSKAKAAKQSQQQATQRRQGGPFAFHQRDRSSGAVTEPLLNPLLDETQIHAAWLIERQAEERARSLIRALDQLASDARTERLEAAAALLQLVAEKVRITLLRDAAFTSFKGTSDKESV